MREKVKVLFMAADPFRPGARRELGGKVRAIERAVRPGSAPGTLEFAARFATRAEDVRDALVRHQPQVVHFVARGGEPGTIYLADEDGRPRPVAKEALRGLFAGCGSVRIVVLDGYDALPLVEALSEVVDYTVGMTGAIADRSAILFAEAFYGALGMGRTVLAAFELGVSRLEMEGGPDAGAPMRRIRRGVNLDATLVARPDADAYGGCARGLAAGLLRRKTFSGLDQP